MFAKFSRVSEACFGMRRCAFCISCLEVVFSKSNACFGGVIVAPGDGGLLDDRR